MLRNAALSLIVSSSRQRGTYLHANGYTLMTREHIIRTANVRKVC